jgi:hypothetical protein
MAARSYSEVAAIKPKVLERGTQIRILKLREVFGEEADQGTSSGGHHGRACHGHRRRDPGAAHPFSSGNLSPGNSLRPGDLRHDIVILNE